MNPSTRDRIKTRLSSIGVAASALMLIMAACSKSTPPEPTPKGLDLRATRVEVVGAGASSVQGQDKIAKEILAPLDKYYEGTLFGITFPAESFEPAFEEFTPTVANAALTSQSALMTPSEVSSRIKGILEPAEVTSTVTVFSPAAGEVTHAGVAVSLRAEGSLDDGAPIEIFRQDFFIVEASSAGWRVASYECRQRIDAPPEASRTESGSSGG